MNPVTSRRIFLGGLMALGSTAVLKTHPRNAQKDARFGAGGIRSFTREPLQVAMLDRHARRLQPLIPELEDLISRRVAIEALTFDQLYANFTIDLLQQTGRYDIVSLSDSWMPFFGRSGYFSEVSMGAEVGGPRSYPSRINEAAVGADGTPLVAHPWTFDFVCSAFSSTAANPDATSDWIRFTRHLIDNPASRMALPLSPEMTSAEVFRAVALSYGQDVIEPETHEPGLDRYGSERAIRMIDVLARHAGVETSLGSSWDQVVQAAVSGTLDHLPLVYASDLGLLGTPTNWRSQLVPVGRDNRATTSGQIWMVAVPAGAPSLDDARIAVQWLTRTDIQQRLWLSCALLPATRPAINDQGGSIAPDAQSLILQALDAWQPVPGLRSFQSVMGISGRMVPSILRDPDSTTRYLTDANLVARNVLVNEGELEA